MYPIFVALILLLWSWRLYSNACQDFATYHPVWGSIQLFSSLALMALATCLALL